MTTIRFYSPVRILGTVPYQNPWEDDGCDFFELNEKQKILCKDKINAEIKKLFSPVNFPVDKVRKASLGTVVKEDRLVSVLTCHCSEKLTRQEIQTLRNWWGWQCRYGCNLSRKIQKREKPGKSEKKRTAPENLRNIAGYSMGIVAKT